MSSPSEQQDKRVVSKSEYYFLRGLCAFLGAQGLFLAIFGALSIVFLFVRWHRTLASHPTYTVWMLFCCMLCIVAGTFMARRTNKAAREMNIVPFTRANTADLPAPDSLVRASAEPMQAQQAILLRAAAPIGEAQEEQLLRASVGGQE